PGRERRVAVEEPLTRGVRSLHAAGGRRRGRLEDEHADDRAVIGKGAGCALDRLEDVVVGQRVLSVSASDAGAGPCAVRDRERVLEDEPELDDSQRERDDDRKDQGGLDQDGAALATPSLTAGSSFPCG